MTCRERYSISCIVSKEFNDRYIRLLMMGNNLNDTNDNWYCERKITKHTLKELDKIKIFRENKIYTLTDVKTYNNILDKILNSSCKCTDVQVATRRFDYYINSLFRRGISNTRR